MNKIFFAFLILFSFIIIPTFSLAWIPGEPLVPCGNGSPTLADGKPDTNYKKCEIKDFFTMLSNIYTFIVFYIVTPLAVLVITIGAIILLSSAGNPGGASMGRKMIYSAIIGTVLALCAWVIVNFVLSTILGISTWSTISF